MIVVPFDLDDIVKLLIGDRQERFEFERAIRLQEFRTWIYWPRKGRFIAAGRVAAVFILESIEDDIFFDEASAAQAEMDPTSGAFVDLSDKPAATLHRISVLRANKQYRQLYDRILADRGGLTRLLYCPSPTEFDAELLKRRERAIIVNDLVDYRLRYARHIGDGGGNITQAVFFKWWPMHDVPGRRGATSELHGIKPLLHAANDIDTLRRFLGAYAFISESIHCGEREKPAVIIPPTVPRVEIPTSPFTAAERQIISDYATNYHSMSY